MHSKFVIHRDVKPENILLDVKNILKLADFGSSTYFTNRTKRKSICGTVEYLSPEIAKNEYYTEKIGN